MIRIRSRAFAMAFVAAAAFAQLPATALAATPGHPSCSIFFKACLAHMDRGRRVSAVQKDKGSSPVQALEHEDSRCYEAYRQAGQTGVWPAHRAHPAIACSRD